MINFAAPSLAEFERNIADVGNDNGPLVIITAGLHGNEPSGVEACERLAPELEKRGISGRVIMMRGNTQALEAGNRMLDYDLNRLWLHRNIVDDKNEGPLARLGGEQHDFHELNMRLEKHLNEDREITLLDLHTTSAQTVPFITMADTLVNRSFIHGFGVPVVIGIEEYIHGALLSYFMERGHRSLAFESGAHNDPGSADRHYHFLWLALEKLGILELTDQEREEHVREISFSKELGNAVFDVRHREVIKKNQPVTVLPGFRNFDPLKPGTKIAKRNKEFLVSDRYCRIFMPLYQAQGSDAYFLIGRMPKWWKYLSRISRNLRLDRFITLLPGVNREAENRILVRPSIAQSRVKHIFHLLGFRFLESSNGKLRFISREV